MASDLWVTFGRVDRSGR